MNKTLEDLALELDLKLNTLRYWIKKNRQDCLDGNYALDFAEMYLNMPVGGRSYIIEDFNEALKSMQDYINAVNLKKEQARENNKLGLFWTNSAVECYENHLNCERCSQKYICEKNIVRVGEDYPMKRTVKKLLEMVGTPFLQDVNYYDTSKITPSIVQIKGV